MVAAPRHGFAHGQAHDVFHGVVDRLDEAGAPLWVLVLGGRAFGLFRFAIVEIIPGAGIFPDAILVVEPDVEPDRTIKRSVLVEAEPRQLVVKRFASLGIGEISVCQAAIGDCAGDAMNELSNGRLASAFMRIRPVRNIAIEIF